MTNDTPNPRGWRRSPAGKMYCESLPLDFLAEAYGTPCYVYSKAALQQAWQGFRVAFSELPLLACYAVKANSNLSLLRLLSGWGAGFDIVSGGELQRVLVAGAKPERIVFSGVGKSSMEMKTALQAGILCFNVESLPELDLLSEVACNLGQLAPVSLRVNPDVDPQTHPYIATGLSQSKFGVPHHQALEWYLHARALPGIKIIGIDCHIGSQITQIEPFIQALERVQGLSHQLSKLGIELRHLDLGGGLGIRYRDEQPIDLSLLASAIKSRLNDFCGRLLLEPGRSIVGPAGLLLTRVNYCKPTPAKNFLIVDAAMNDLIRPALYGAWHEIVSVDSFPDPSANAVDVVGPICESGDILGENRRLSAQHGELLAILDAGAYGTTMGSNYNSRPLPPEILVDQDRHHLIRRRQTVEELYQLEWPPVTL